jgi:sigma-B regulation protein RsbU (phosphoserine phosphatase)
VSQGERDGSSPVGFEELVPGWMFVLRPAWARLAASVLVPAAFLAPLILIDHPEDLRLGPVLVAGVLLVAAVAGWWATGIATVLTTVGYWWFGVPVARSFRLDDGRDAVALLAMAAFGAAVVVMAKRVERAVEDVRALDRTRRSHASAEAALRRATERAMVEVEGVLHLSNALAKARTMAEVAKVACETIAMPAWPTTASVAIVHGDRLRILAARGATAASIEALEQIDLSTSSWLGEVIAGRPAIVDDRDRFAVEHPDARVLRIYPSGSWAVIPFRSESTTGLLSLYWYEPQPLTEFARYFSLVAEILATGLERAHAEEDRQTHLTSLEHAFAQADRIARTLSTTLLPPQLPELPGFSSAGWLMPAHDEVAGDFYDLFSVPGGGWVAVLGDVCGKGAEAAAVTSLARYAARATALSDPDTARIADVVNTALVEDESDVFCTMGVVRFAHERGEVDVTLAGHPQLRLLHDGVVTRVGRYGSVLGYATTPPVVQRHALPAGAAIVLFSDGLIERHPDFGEDELDALLLTAPDGPAEVLAAYVRERILAVPPARHDDLALLVVKRET